MLGDQDFKIINFKIDLSKDGIPYNFKFEDNRWLKILREEVLIWKTTNAYKDIIKEGIGLKLKGSKDIHRKLTWYAHYALFKTIRNYFPDISKNEMYKKSGYLLAAINFLPSEMEYLQKMNEDSKYKSYLEYLADLFEKKIREFHLASTKLFAVKTY